MGEVRSRISVTGEAQISGTVRDQSGAVLPGDTAFKSRGRLRRAFTPCSTVGNTNMRRVLYDANPDIGQYYAGIAYADDGASRTYNGMVLQIQRRRFKGVTIQGNYTWSHCIDDGYNDVIQGAGNQTQDRRRPNRANCETDRRHNFNLSTVYETPKSANRMLNALAGGWSVSG